jgi:hypothetical protein
VGVRFAQGDVEPEERAPALEPSKVTAAVVAVVVFLLLLANGRSIPAGDTRVNDRVAASLVTEGDFDLDEYADVEAPFVREVDGRRVSIYPVLSSVLAAPVFALVRLAFPLDEVGLGLAGKLAASLFSALAAAALFLAVARRRSEGDGLLVALVFALGTSVWSTSQDLWQHPAAVLGVAVGLLFLARAEDDDFWAGAAGLPLGVAVAARHADVALVLALALSAAVRWPRRIPWMGLWALPPLALVAVYDRAYFGDVLRQGFGDASARFDAPWGVGHAGLLVSPAKGLLVFTPVVLVGVVGLVRGLRGEDRGLALSAGLAATAHWALLGRWGEWHGGESWGPRMMTDALPALVLFLPEGFDLLRALAWLLAVVSWGVQALGAFSYDLRWERLYQRPQGHPSEALWQWRDSPIPFHLKERVVILAAPGVHEGRVVERRHPVVVAGPAGSEVSFGAGAAHVTGARETLSDVHLQKAAEVVGDHALLRGNWAAIFFRVAETARAAPLRLTIDGRGHGTVYVGERSFWAPETRWTTHVVSGTFRIEQPYFYPESGGGDILITIGRAPGEAEIRTVAFVATSGLAPGGPGAIPAR